MKYIIALVLSLITTVTFAADNIVNLYNWSGYLPDTIIKQFRKETGIQINYSTYDNNETMYAKLKANPEAGYDVIVPSSYFIDRMSRQGMLQKLDKTKLPNFKHMNPALLNKDFDRNNEYSMPYFWGTTGIVLNTQHHPKGSVTKWSQLWDKKYKGQLLMLDDTREIFSMALLSLGFSANSQKPDEIKAAYLKLKELLPNVKLFNTEAQEAIYIDEEVTVGMGWSGTIYMSRKENPHLEYVFPQDGFVVWLDSMVIPVNAPHLENAYKLINFLMRPDIAKQIGIITGYATANLSAVNMLPPEVRNNPIIYPDEATLRRGTFQTDPGDQAALYERYMESLKIGQ